MPAILAVCDDRAVYAALDAALLDLGFELVTAHDAREAAEALRRREFAVLVVDIDRPDASDLLERLRNLAPAFRSSRCTGRPRAWSEAPATLAERLNQCGLRRLRSWPAPTSRAAAFLSVAGRSSAGAMMSQSIPARRSAA